MSLFDPKCHYKWNAYLPTVNQYKRHQSLYFPHNTSHFPTGCYCEWRPWQYFMHKFLTLPTICERYSSGFRYWGKTGTSRGKPQGSFRPNDHMMLHPCSTKARHHHLYRSMNMIHTAHNMWVVSHWVQILRQKSPHGASRTVHLHQSHHAACLYHRNCTSPHIFMTVLTLPTMWERYPSGLRYCGISFSVSGKP